MAARKTDIVGVADDLDEMMTVCNDNFYVNLPL